MAKNSRKKEQAAPRRPAAAQVAMYLGIAQAVIGALIIFAETTHRLSGPPWLRTAGLVLIVSGGVFWFLSGLPREQAIEWIKSGLFALCLALLIRWPIAEPYRIPSGSMEPTLIGDERIGRGDRVFVNKWIYGVRYPFLNKRIWYGAPPQRWDIVVFKTVEKNAEHPTLVKRIVGMPGEHIQIRDGKVYADGIALELPVTMSQDIRYTTMSQYGVRPEEEFSRVPEGHYLVLGDNSANSRDGRFFGWLPNEHIVGRVSCIWWPPAHWRDFTGFSQTWWWRATVAVLAFLLAVRLFIGRSWAVAGPCGKGTDHRFVSFLAYGLHIPFTRRLLLRWAHPRRGDLVLYEPGEGHSDTIPNDVLLMGQIAGLPGETIAINEGTLLVEGEVIDGPEALTQNRFVSKHPEALYGRSKTKNYSKVPEGHYFILSDAPGEETDEAVFDSRIAGWVPERNLMGRATLVWWPPHRWRRIKP